MESAVKLLSYTDGLTFDSFTADSKTTDAVIRNFEVIGEAANRLSDEFRNLHQHIDWHRIRGFRNRIVHDYFGIDYSIVWQIKEHFLPDLVEKLRQIPSG